MKIAGKSSAVVTAPRLPAGRQGESRARKNGCPTNALYPITFMLMLLLFLSLPSALFAAVDMKSYCAVPPYARTSAMPNVLLMIDNSASQYDLEYTDTSATSTFCYDASYNNSKICIVTSPTACTANTDCQTGQTCSNGFCTYTTSVNCTSDSGCPTVNAKCEDQYPGYFDQSKFYASTGVSYDTDTTAGNTTFSTFTEVASMSACTTVVAAGTTVYQTNYLCLDVTATTGTVTVPGTCKKNATSHPAGTYSCVHSDCSCLSDADCLGGASNTCQGVTTTAGGTTYDVTNFTASGKFLNWLATSKMDIQKKILTGGKYDATNQLLVSEGRGCVGSRYVKEVPGSQWVPAVASAPVSFGVRGEKSSDITVPSTGGTTRIDIYKGDFAAAGSGACASAVNCWSTCGGSCGGSGGCGTCKNDSNTCLSLSATGGDSATWNHALQSCWTCAHQPCCPEDITLPGSGVGGGNDYTRIWGTNECGQIGYDYTNLSPTNPRYICTKDYSSASVSPPDATTFSGCSMDNYAGDVTAHLAAGTDGRYIGICSAFAEGTVEKQNCTRYQFAYFCRGMKVGEVVDPSSGSTDTSCTGNIPANFMDGGLTAALGTPIRTFHARASLATAPTGVLYNYKDQIRFGAMKFNDFGSKTECGAPYTSTITNIIYTCSDTSNKDGGNIISYVGAGFCLGTSTACNGDSDCTGVKCVPNVGDHTTGLVRQIDAIQAATWTPFSEGLFTATSYFANGTNTLLPALNTTADFSTTYNPVQVPCQTNNVLLITDGMSTADLNSSVTGLVSNTTACGGTCNITGQTDTTVNANIKYAGSRNVADVAAIAQQRKITDFSTTPVYDKDRVTTHVVFSGTGNSQTGEANPLILMQDTARYGGGTFLLSNNYDQLSTSIASILDTVIKRAAAGTAASVLASGEGSGANLVQAVYYPKRKFQDAGSVWHEIGWTGRLSNLWYFVDPFFSGSSIYENTTLDSTTAPILNLNNDYKVTFNFVTDPNSPYFDQTVVNLSTTSGTSQGTEAFELLKTLWEGGYQLWKMSPDDRTIYTTTDGTTLLPFTTANAGTLESRLQAVPSGTNVEATNIINYTRGFDVDINSTLGHRSREFYKSGETPAWNIWKLGDVIDSTPRIASSVPINSYDLVYQDTSYSNFTKGVNGSGYPDRGMVFSGANDGMLHAFYLGKLSTTWSGQGTSEKAKLTDSGIGFGKELWAFIPQNVLPYLRYMADPTYCHVYAVDLTTEVVDLSVGAKGDSTDPTDPRPDCTGSSCTWRTYIIGGMRYGGACKNSTSSCTVDVNGDGVIDAKDCVKTPVSGVGYSSYFALDITDTLRYPGDVAHHPPVLMWEFSDADLATADKGLGFTTTGPAVVRIGDKSRNGKWFVVFASGPTGPNSGAPDYQFLGRSDQPLKFYAFDIKAGPHGTDGYQVIGPETGSLLTTIDKAFAGTMAKIDPDLNYQDNAIYVPYTRDCTADDDAATCPTGSWSNGGIVRIITKENPDPSQWKWSVVIDNVGPVTTSLGKLLKKKGCFTSDGALVNPDVNEGCLWLYGGTGRYYYKTLSAIDDPDNKRKLFGIKEPCYSSLASGNLCHKTAATDNDVTTLDTTGLSAEDISDLENTANASGFRGWKINLASCSDSAGAEIPSLSGGCSSTSVYFRPERVVTDTSVSGQGTVFFTSFRPYNAPCQLGGKTFLWAVRYNTGGAPLASTLKGEALLQVSTGSIVQVELSQVFTAAGGRRTSGTGTTDIEGIGGGGPQILGAPAATRRVVHIRER